MVKQIGEGSIVLAHVAAMCRPQVIAAYPITPSTHIPQELSRIQPQHNFEFIPVEAEFSAISAILGASVAGARVFTATSSQGLALMHEVLHNAAGMRLPLVMVVGNRSLSAPLSIWSDWQDSLSQRDTGWIQLYCKNNQETIDALIQAYRIAETAFVPIMVCFEGFYLTHEVAVLDVPTQQEIDSFLPPFNPKDSLDTRAPKAFGAYAAPEYYQDFKLDQQQAIMDSVKVIERVAADFEKKFKRKQFTLIEEYGEKAPVVLVSMGALAESLEVLVDETKGVSLLRVKCFRPFPSKEIAGALKHAKQVIVFEKDFSPGNEGILGTELKAALLEAGLKPKVASVVCGLGGRDVTNKQISAFVNKIKNKEGRFWI
ncbi:MAG: pyruvate ferredoxin oxidoreductase [Candidatus Micrarchaeota archaeon]